jgi:hypothetical protein
MTCRAKSETSPIYYNIDVSHSPRVAAPQASAGRFETIVMGM